MRSVRLPAFSGEHKNFQVWWWMIFSAYAAIHGFAQSVRKTRDPDLPATEDASINVKTDDGKKQLKAKKLNVIAIANLTMSFTSEALIGMVYSEMIDEWPTGVASNVVWVQFKKYCPQDLVSKIEPSVISTLIE